MLLEAENLTFHYGPVPALAGVSLSLGPGQIVALLGPNGSGKSTLLRLLLGHASGQGVVRWKQTPLQQWRPKDLAKTVAYLAQTPTFDPGSTVAEVLRLGRAPFWNAFGLESPRDAAVVAQVADQLALTSLLSRGVEQLSGGQRQRVFIGRCLVQEPAAILLDEPSTYLDLQHQVSLAQLLQQLARERGIGVLMASHDLNLALATADRIIVLAAGTVAFTGSPEALSAEVLSEVYHVPMARVALSDGRSAFLPQLTA